MVINQYFYEVFENMERQGPGSSESTRKAIAACQGWDTAINILDVGCGVGAPTFVLAENFPLATITAIDNHPPFIDQLNRSAAQKGLTGRVKGECMSMLEMTFADESFDLLWSEGSIFIAGFERGINDWKRLLRKGGLLLCSDACWLTDSPPQEIYDYWQEEYPEIDTVAGMLQKIDQAGYAVKTHFISPVTDWTANFYDPMQLLLDAMRGKYAGIDAAREVIDMLQLEIEMYRQYSHTFSYGFFVMEKI